MSDDAHRQAWQATGQLYSQRFVKAVGRLFPRTKHLQEMARLGDYALGGHLYYISCQKSPIRWSDVAERMATKAGTAKLKREAKWRADLELLIERWRQEVDTVPLARAS